MSYTDLSAAFSYKKRIHALDFTQLADQSKVHHDALDGAVFGAYPEFDFTIVNAAITRIPCDVPLYDNKSAYDNVTNYKFTPPAPGYYLLIAQVTLAGESGMSLEIGLERDGQFETFDFTDLQCFFHSQYTSASKDVTMMSKAIVYHPGGSHYWSFFVAFNASGNKTGRGGQEKTFFHGQRIASNYLY